MTCYMFPPTLSSALSPKAACINRIYHLFQENLAQEDKYVNYLITWFFPSRTYSKSTHPNNKLLSQVPPQQNRFPSHLEPLSRWCAPCWSKYSTQLYFVDMLLWCFEGRENNWHLRWCDRVRSPPSRMLKEWNVCDWKDDNKLYLKREKKPHLPLVKLKGQTLTHKTSSKHHGKHCSPQGSALVKCHNNSLVISAF